MENEQERLNEIAKERALNEAQIVSVDSINKGIEALRKQLRAMEAAAEDVKRKNYKIRMKNADLEREEATLVSSLKLKAEAARQAQEMQLQFEELERATKDALWRTGLENGFKIKEYQDYGAKFMAIARRVICADEMGLGKTLESIAATDMMGSKKILIITPGEVMSGYLAEIARWTRRPAIVIGRKPKTVQYQTLQFLKEADELVIIVNYESWARDKKLLTMLEGMQFDTVIADEAHRIKEVDTSAYKGVKQIVDSDNVCVSCGGAYVKDMCVKCGQRWTSTKSVRNLILLTGTPILNRPIELFPLLNLCQPEIFPTLNRFIRLFCVDISDDPRRREYVFREGGFEALAEKIQGMYIRRTTESVGLELPPQEVRIHELDLDPETYPLQTEILRMLQEYAQIVVDENPGIDFMSQLALLTRIRQAAVWPGGIKIKRQEHYPNGEPVWFEDPDTGERKPVMEELTIGDRFRESIKLDTCMELIEEYLSEGKRIVIFSQFAEVIRELLARCEHKNYRAVGYYGDTPHQLRDQVKTNFDKSTGEEPKWDIVICHYATGGVGVNFTACERMILTDEAWNPGIEDQAMKRINRIGQTEKTQVDILRINNHIDSWLAALIADKRSMINNFNDRNEIYAEIRSLLLRKS